MPAPKDKDNKELKVGDIVTIEAIITSIVNDKTVGLEIENWNWISCPSKQVTKVQSILSDDDAEVLSSNFKEEKVS